MTIWDWGVGEEIAELSRTLMLFSLKKNNLDIHQCISLFCYRETLFLRNTLNCSSHVFIMQTDLKLD